VSKYASDFMTPKVPAYPEPVLKNFLKDEKYRMKG
jgi:hypothetical protein